MTADDGTFLVLLAMLVLAVAGAIVLGIQAVSADDARKAELARREQAERLLSGSRHREREAIRLLGEREIQLEDSRRRERLALNLLADAQNIAHPFPDVTAADGSLEDGLTDLRWITDEVERHANTPSEQ